MATITVYFLNTAATSPNWFGKVQDGGSAPAGALSPFGWTVGKTAVTSPYWRGRIGATATATVAAAASYVDAAVRPVQGTGAGNTTAGDSFRSDNPLNGTFAAGNWNFTFGMRTAAITTVGRVRFNVWASANADGTGTVRKLNSATLVGTIVTMATTTTTYNSTVTWAAPQVVLSDEYLFVQIEWQETTAGTANGCTAQFYQASFVTTDYVYAPATGTLVEVEDPDDFTASGLVGLIGTLADAEDVDVAAMAGDVAWPEITGTLVDIEDLDVANFSGDVAAVVTELTGLLAVIEPVDASTFTGGIYGTGTLVTIEAVDGAAFTVTATWLATLAVTEARDTALVTGGIVATGPFAVTEIKETALLTGGIYATGTLSSIEVIDTALVTGGIYGTGTLVTTETRDAYIGTGEIVGAGVGGALTADEAADSAALTGQVTGFVGALAVTEGKETFNAAGQVAWSATLTANEIRDTASISGQARWLALLAATEASDVADVTAALAVQGTLAADEVTDKLAAAGRVYGGTGKVNASYTLVGRKTLVEVEAAKMPVALVAQKSKIVAVEAQRSTENRRAQK